MPLTTYQDLIEHALDYLGADATAEGARYARRAVLSAYDDLAKGHRWTYYLQRGRLVTSAQQTTGTIAYDHTGGTYELQVTLSDATWPSWAALGTLLIGSVAYDIAERKSDTVLTLAETSNPGADVAAGTSYTLYRDTYPMPTDFQEAGELILPDLAGGLSYVRPAGWLEMQRTRLGPGLPRFYTFTGDHNYLGAMGVRFWPPPDTAMAVDYMYKRFPRPLAVQQYGTGTVSITSGSTTVTGSGTAWDASHVGCVLRLSAGSQYVPTGRAGAYPFRLERVVLSVESATSLTVDADPAETLSGVKYALSDPVDVDSGPMLTLLLREVEKQSRLGRRMRPSPEELREYEVAQDLAWGADSRSFERRAAGGMGRFPSRLADLPLGADA